jgi:hypothetical protein
VDLGDLGDFGISVQTQMAGKCLGNPEPPKSTTSPAAPRKSAAKRLAKVPQVPQVHLLPIRWRDDPDAERCRDGHVHEGGK